MGDEGEAHLLSFNRLRDVTVGNPLSKAFGYGCLPNAGFPNEARVVLRPPAQDLSHTFYLILPANNRVELTLAAADIISNVVSPKNTKKKTIRRPPPLPALSDWFRTPQG